MLARGAGFCVGGAAVERQRGFSSTALPPPPAARRPPRTIRKHRRVEPRHERVDEPLRRHAVDVRRRRAWTKHVVQGILGVARAVGLLRGRVDLEDGVAVDAPREALVLLLAVERAHAHAHAVVLR